MTGTNNQLFTQVGVEDAEGRRQHETGWRCPSCDMTRGEDGIDPCLTPLRGVKFACCGHGGFGNCPGYVFFENGQVIRFSHCEVDGVAHVVLNERPRTSGTFPFFDLSRRFGVPYAQVLEMSARAHQPQTMIGSAVRVVVDREARRREREAEKSL